MAAKDILRIALFVLFAIFALWPGFRTRIRVPGSDQIKGPVETDNKEIR